MSRVFSSTVYPTIDDTLRHLLWGANVPPDVEEPDEEDDEDEDVDEDDDDVEEDEDEDDDDEETH